MVKVDLKAEYKYYRDTKKDPKNFDQIYRSFLEDVNRFAYSIVQNQHDAEDITANVFLDFYKKFPEYEWRNVSMKYWLFTAVRNYAMNKFRTKQAVSLEDEDQVEDITQISFVDEIINKSTVKEVNKQIDKLESDERMVINLRIWEDISFKEIGKIMSLSESGARMRFNRAITKVQKSLNIKLNSISLPVLFTAISCIEKPVVPLHLAKEGFNYLLINQTMKPGILTAIKTFLTTKAGIVITTSVAIPTVLVAGTGAYIVTNPNNKTNDASSNPSIVSYVDDFFKATPTSTPTLIPSSTMTPTPEPSGTAVTIASNGELPGYKFNVKLNTNEDVATTKDEFPGIVITDGNQLYLMISTTIMGNVIEFKDYKTLGATEYSPNLSRGKVDSWWYYSNELRTDSSCGPLLSSGLLSTPPCAMSVMSSLSFDKGQNGKKSYFLQVILKDADPSTLARADEIMQSLTGLEKVIVEVQ